MTEITYEYLKYPQGAFWLRLHEDIAENIRNPISVWKGLKDTEAGRVPVLRVVFGSALSDDEKEKLDSVIEQFGHPLIPQHKKFGHAYWAKVRSFNIATEKPLTAGRIYKGQEIEINCYVTERIKELYQDGKLNIDDYVIVQFIDGDQDKPVAIAKGYKTW